MVRAWSRSMLAAMPRPGVMALPRPSRGLAVAWTATMALDLATMRWQSEPPLPPLPPAHEACHEAPLTGQVRTSRARAAVRLRLCDCAVLLCCATVLCDCAVAVHDTVGAAQAEPLQQADAKLLCTLCRRSDGSVVFLGSVSYEWAPASFAHGAAGWIALPGPEAMPQADGHDALGQDDASSDRVWSPTNSETNPGTGGSSQTGRWKPIAFGAVELTHDGVLAVKGGMLLGRLGARAGVSPSKRCSVWRATLFDERTGRAVKLPRGAQFAAGTSDVFCFHTAAST